MHNVMPIVWYAIALSFNSELDCHLTQWLNGLLILEIFENRWNIPDAEFERWKCVNKI